MTLHKLTVLAILAHAALSNPITRRHHGIQHIPMNTHLTFWRDRECSAMNGHLNVDISNRGACPAWSPFPHPNDTDMSLQNGTFSHPAQRPSP